MARLFLWLCLVSVRLCGEVGCAEVNVEEEGGYFMREHSLVVPYQGQGEVGVE